MATGSGKEGVPQGLSRSVAKKRTSAAEAALRTRDLRHG